MYVLRSATFWFTLLTLVLAVAVGMGLGHRIEMTSLHEVREEVQQWRPWMTVCRWTILAAVLVTWRRMTQTRLQQHKFSPAQHEVRQAQDRRILVILLLIELAIGQRWLIQTFNIG